MAKWFACCDFSCFSMYFDLYQIKLIMGNVGGLVGAARYVGCFLVWWHF